MELNIYNRAGELKETVSPSSSSQWVREIGAEYVVSLSFKTWDFFMLDVNDYIEMGGCKFKIKKEYRPKQISTQEYSYQVHFYGREHDAEDIKLCRLTQGEDDLEVTFAYEATPLEMLTKVVQNLNRNTDNVMWRVGEAVYAPRQTFEFNDVFCWDALNNIAAQLETEWWIDGDYLNMCKCERGESVSLGYMQGLTSLTQQENSNTVRFFTRLIPRGSTKNIDRNKYGYDRLQLPSRAKFIDLNTKYGLKEHVEEAAFEGIFPHRVGTLSAVRNEEKENEETGKFIVYHIKDNGLPFNPDDYRLDGKVIHLTFQSGNLQGKDFEVNWNYDTQEFEIINIYPDSVTQLPGGNMIPAVGDAYILWNLRMPESYTTAAEQEYESAVNNFLSEYARDTAIYSGDTDYIYVNTNKVPLVLGQRVHLLSSEYFGETGYRDSRITKICCKLENLSIATIGCCNTVGHSWKNSIESSIGELKYTLAEQQKKGEAKILKTGDTEVPSEYNVFSALRALGEFISKKKDDIVQGVITFLKGIRIGKFVTGLIGGSGASIYLDSDGKTVMEADKAVFREELVVPKITFNCIDVISGDKANTFAYGRIKTVDKEKQVATLDLLDDQWGTLHVNDICRGVFHNIEGGNYTDDAYDDNGFMGYSGFATSYFTPTRIVESKAGGMTFEYSLQAGTNIHPMPGMNFFAYGNFTDVERQAITYENRYYTRRMTGVNTWIIHPTKNISMQDGLLEGLTIGNMEMHGYGYFGTNQYLTGVHIQFTPSQIEEIRGDSVYNVSLSDNEGVITVDVDDDGNIIGGLTELQNVIAGGTTVVNGSDNVVTTSYKLKTRIQVFKAATELVYSDTMQIGRYVVRMECAGCSAVITNGVLYVINITDLDTCYVAMKINCEGKAVFDKVYKVTVIRNGRNPIIADIDNEMASVACDQNRHVVLGLPVSTTVSAWYGTTPLALDKIELQTPSGVTATADAQTGRITVTAISDNAADTLPVGITIHTTFRGSQYITKLTLTINKQVSGENAVIYQLLPSVNSVKINEEGQYTDAFVSCKVTMTEGKGTYSLSSLPSWLVIKYSYDGGNELDYAYGSDISFFGKNEFVKFSLYKDTVLLDRETIPMVIDGQSAVIADLDNEMDSVACDDLGHVISGLPVNTNASMFGGTAQLVLTSVSLSAPAGVTTDYVNNGSYATVSVTAITDAADVTLPIVITLKAVYLGVTYTRSLTFTVNKLIAGENAVIHNLLPSTSTVKIDDRGNYSHPSVSCAITVTNGKNNVGSLESVPSGFSIKYSINNATEATYTYGSAVNITGIKGTVRFFLYKGSVLIDQETIPVIMDGTTVVVADLDNEMDGVACDQYGNVTGGLPLRTNVYIYAGSTQLTVTSVMVSTPAGVTAGYVNNGSYATVSVTAITSGADDMLPVSITVKADSGGVQYTRTVTFTVSKIRQGDTAVVYRIHPSVDKIRKTVDGVNSPSFVFCSLSKVEGNKAAVSVSSLPSSYSLYYSIDGSSNMSCGVGQPISASGASTNVVFSLYYNGTVVDRETVVVLKDGERGDKGNPGEPGSDGSDGISYYLVPSVTQIGSTATGSPEPSSFTVYHKSKVGYGTINNTSAYMAVWGSNDGVGYTMIGSCSYTTYKTVNAASYPYKYFVIRTYSISNPSWNSTYLLSVSVNRVYDGTDGAIGTAGAMPRPCGLYSSSKTYVYNDDFRDIVYDNNGRVWMVQTHGTSMYGKPPSSYAGNGWLEGSKEVFTAIDTALIDGANIAGFGFKNGVMASLDGQTTDSFNPENSKLILDGKRGRATILEGVFKRLYFEDCFTKNRFLNLRGVHLNEYDPEESYRIGDCYYSGSSIYTHQSDGDTKLDYGYVYTGYFSYIVNPAYSRMIQAGCAEAGKMNVIYMPDVSEDNYGTEVVICVPSRIGTRSVTGEEGRCVVSQRNVINVDERTLLIGDDTKGGDVTLVSTPMGWLVKTLHHVGCDNARVMRLLFGGGSSSYSVSIDSACININTSKISVKRNGVGDVTVTIRSGTAGFFYGSHVNVTGYGNVLGSSESPVKATIGDISYSSLSYDFIVRVLLSDDSSRNDGSFFMDVYSSKSIYIGKTSE